MVLRSIRIAVRATRAGILIVCGKRQGGREVGTDADAEAGRGWVGGCIIKDGQHMERN